MRLFVTVLLLLSFPSPSTGNKQQSKTQENQDAAAPATAPTSPVTVVISQPPAEPQTPGAQANSQYPYEWFWPPVWSNWALVIAAAIAATAAIHTLRAIDNQVVEMRKTGEQTDKLIKENIAQSASLERSVAETARSASAMEGVSKSLEITAKSSAESVEGLRQQMRAYVGTAIGGAAYQDRAQNTRFMASPWLTNHGFTPAHKVRHKSKAAILAVPLPSDFDYPVPAVYVGETIMQPRQQNQINIIVDDFINDADIANAKASNGSGLYVWGTIEYEDIFGDVHCTRFCQLLTWLPDGKTVWGTFIAGHNDGT